MLLRRALLSLLLSAPLAAQVLEPGQIGVQARGSLPLAGFSEALGGAKLPGLGVSLLAEFDLGDRLHARGALGVDRWFEGASALASEDRAIQAFHLTAEGLYFMREDGALVAKGPYLLAGLGAYGWSLGRDVTGQSRKVMHMAATLGLGWRLDARLDGEIKLLAGVVDPGLSALALMGCVTYRF